MYEIIYSKRQIEILIQKKKNDQLKYKPKDYLVAQQLLISQRNSALHRGQ